MDRSTVAGMLEKIKTDKDFNIQKGQLCSVNHKNISKRKMYVQYVVQSKSNATDDIKHKLLLVQKHVFLWNFPPIYCRSESTFQWAPITAGSRRRTGLRSQNAWPHPRSSSSPPGSALWHTADSFLWLTRNILPRTDQAKTVHFWEPGSCRRLTKCTQRRQRAHQIWSLIANLFTRHRTSSRMLKFVLTEPVGHGQDPS